MAFVRVCTCIVEHDRSHTVTRWTGSYLTRRAVRLKPARSRWMLDSPVSSAIFIHLLVTCADVAYNYQKAPAAMSLPLVRIPASTSVHRLGASSLAPASAVLRFGQTGWTIPRSSAKDGRQGWAIVGDAEGRRLMVEVCLAV